MAFVSRLFGLLLPANSSLSDDLLSAPSITLDRSLIDRLYLTRS